jgi:hypothetical protein
MPEFIIRIPVGVSDTVRVTVQVNLSCSRYRSDGGQEDVGCEEKKRRPVHTEATSNVPHSEEVEEKNLLA